MRRNRSWTMYLPIALAARLVHSVRADPAVPPSWLAEARKLIAASEYHVTFVPVR